MGVGLAGPADAPSSSSLSAGLPRCLLAQVPSAPAAQSLQDKGRDVPPSRPPCSGGHRMYSLQRTDSLTQVSMALWKITHQSQTALKNPFLNPSGRQTKMSDRLRTWGANES